MPADPLRSEHNSIGRLTSKLIAAFFIVLCFAVGAVGLVLPIIPGLLFVAIALMIVARHFPSIDRQLRRSKTIRSYLNSADGFSGLSFASKVQFGCLLCLRLFIDAVALIVLAVGKVLGLAATTYQSYR